MFKNVQSSPFGRVTYDIIGDDSAPVYFKIDEFTGKITIARGLVTENVDVYQVSFK